MTGRRRRLGQNFLIDPGVADRIVALLCDDPERVLEIGPGRGALTGLLADRFQRVVALELDPGLAQRLRVALGGRPVEVVEGDALSASLEELLGAGPRWQLVANLPYSVGTAILRRLLPRYDLLERLVVMLQREVAERVVARPGEAAHGLLALERAAHADARIAFHVPPGAFRPRPKVTSTVLELALRPPAAPLEQVERALGLAAHALLHRRKTLANSLKGRVSTGQIELAGLDPRARPGTVGLEGWLRLAHQGAPSPPAEVIPSPEW